MARAAAVMYRAKMLGSTFPPFVETNPHLMRKLRTLGAKGAKRFRSSREN